MLRTGELSQRSLEESEFVMTGPACPPATTCEVADTLPAFALLTLPEDDLRRIEDHLETCAGCRAELSQVLDALATVASETVAPPRPAARAAFLARACNGGDRGLGDERRCRAGERGGSIAEPRDGQRA